MNLKVTVIVIIILVIASVLYLFTKNIVSTEEQQYTVSIFRNENRHDILESEATISSGNLSFTNNATGEHKNFDTFDLVSSEIFASIREAPVGFYLSTNEFGWSSKKDEYWGYALLRSGGDPPLFFELSIFAIDIKTWKVKKFTISDIEMSFYGSIDMNIDRGLVLYEVMKKDGELQLNLFNVINNSVTNVVTYNSTTIIESCDRSDGNPIAIIYYYPTLTGGCDQDRSLHPHWEDTTIVYTDFVTRKEIMVIK